jgi:hypothetical protein
MALLLHLTYAGIAVTSTLGAILFVGFTFRPAVTFLWFNVNQSAYPRTLVMTHMASALATWGLFTAYMARRGLGDAFVDVAYAMVVATLAVGSAFFIRYDFWSRPLRWRLVGAHLILAVFTFIAVVIAFPLVPAPPQHVPRSMLGRHSSLWANVRQNLQLELRNRRGRAHGAAPRSR